MQADSALQLSDETFEAEVTKFDGVVLVDFWAVWCVPCQAMTPRIEELALKYKGNDKVKIGQVNVDEAPELSQTYSILSIPTFGVWAKGEMVNSLVGARPTKDLDDMIEKALGELK